MKILILILLSLFICNIKSESNNILKDYVETVDPNYKFTLNATYDIDYANVYVLELVSQQWMKNETSDSIWRHWVYACVPKNYNATHETAILYITGGPLNQDWTIPSQSIVENDFGQELCKQSQSITITVNEVPNEYITMDDGVARTEDGIVAYTWRKYIDTKVSEWVSLLPQTKSATAAMTAAQQFGQQNGVKISKFVVTGASKRGWTTYGVAMAQDSRVVAIVPLVIGVANLVDAIKVQIQAYGNWSFALQDYVDNGIPSFVDTEYFGVITDIVDPINYIDVLENIPKYIIFSLFDEFFLPDSSKFFYSQFKGEKRFGLFQTDHGGIVTTNGIATQISDYFISIVNQKQIPELSWNITYSDDKNTGTINMTVTKGTPNKVVVYSVDTVSKTKRDFRLLTCADLSCYQQFSIKTYTVNLTSDNSYSFTLSKPTDGGWTAFYFEVQFNNVTNVNTELAIVPDIYPFEECSPDICASGVPAWVGHNSTSSSSSSSNSSTSDDSNEEINGSNTIKSSLFIILLIITYLFI